MRLQGLVQPLLNCDKFQKILNNIENNMLPVEVYGISDSSKSYIINGLYSKVDKPLIIFTHSDLEARNLYEDLSFYTNQVYYLPSREVVFYNIDAISGDVRWERLKVLKEMISGRKKIIVTCIDTLVSRYTPIELFRNYIFKISVGQIIDLKEISRILVQCGYERVVTVENKGQFSIRGGIFDIYPPTTEMPYRIEMFDDEVDSIRTFNTNTQRSIDKVFSIEVYPAKEIILSEENLQRGYDGIQTELDEVVNKLDKKKDSEKIEKLKSIVKDNLESLKERWSFETIESYITYFYDNTSTFLDYMNDCFILLDDAARCEGKLESVYTEFNENFNTFLDRGSILPKQGELLINKQQIFDAMKYRCKLSLCGILKKSNLMSPFENIGFKELTLNNYHGQLDFLIDDIKKKKEDGVKILILSGTKSRGERLIQTLRERDIESSYKDNVLDIQDGEVVVTYGNQLSGFEFPELKICVVSDKGVFGEAKRKIKSKKNKKGVGKIKSFTDLKLGDYVVHVNHGIGVYKGIKQLEIKGHKKDYLVISYLKNDILYVPVEQLDMIQKFIGGEGKSPKVNKLGGSEWVKAKKKVKKSVENIAQELIKLYATRSLIKGFKYDIDTPWQKQFEDEFPYEETPDQFTAIEEIKENMESEKPMDRLLCGDVGYGKTEVAIRAAFKAVMSGKQVAFLVPTTILAKQHYNNFIQRFSSFPIKIDMLSRFRTTQQQKKTIQALKEGNVEVIIGTHKLLQKDIKFKDLGLLIVDEEQRFGVTHKEKIKNMKKNVDVLTLSATPIPRTLHMSLTGVRDISVIETPPEERYPIQTYVVEFNDQLIRDAIVREISRGGQVYFVYNRVETIKDMATYLSKLVPEAKVVVGHGQMTERELEKVMADFMDKEYDILLSTTIIETGIDIKNVNTMIIYDADKMGLSQLYQLRGRVGRSSRIAYAYFTYKKDKILTEVAEKRLKAIKEFTELGSGFKIAMRDLEIRGAGNMMGSSQHGHMSVVGYDLYCRMLEDSVSKIKGEIVEEPIETTVDIKIDAFIPEDYIKDETQKIEVYKKIASIESKEEMDDVIEELEDRFSNIPKSLYNLINIAYTKCTAKSLGIIEMKEVKNEVIIEFKSNKKFSHKLFTELMKEYKNDIQFKMGEEKPTIAYKITNLNKEGLIDKLLSFLQYFKAILESK